MNKFIYVILLLLLPLTLCTENWPNWRGPFLNGSSTEINLPTEWSTSKNVKWTCKLQGISAGTPVIWEDKIFVTSFEKTSGELLAMCINKTNGKVLWKLTAWTGNLFKRNNNPASISPVTDGNYVYFYFGTGQLIACTMEGKKIWERNITDKYGKFQIKFGYSSSPLLYNDKLYISVLHGMVSKKNPINTPRPDSYLLCIDTKTGNDIWRHIRKTDAIYESVDCYNTPYKLEVDNTVQIILNGADYVTAHNPETGNEIWRSDNYNLKNNHMYRTIPSSVGYKGIVIAPESRGMSIFAYPANKKETLTINDRLWIQKNAPDVCTPLIYKDKLFVLDGKRKTISCIEPISGKVFQKKQIQSTAFLYTSPTGADNKIYCMNLKGEVFIFSADEKLKLLNHIIMNEPNKGSSISVSDNKIFIRTNTKLYCIGK